MTPPRGPLVIDADALRAEHYDDDGGFIVPERFWNDVVRAIERGGRWFGEGGIMGRPLWDNTMNLPPGYVQALESLPRAETVVTGLALEQTAALYGLSRRNEPGGDPETDDDLRARVRTRIYDASSSPSEFGVLRNSRDEVLPSFRGQEFRFTPGATVRFPRGDVHSTAAEASRPRALFDSDYSCTCPTCRPPPSVDRTPPDFEEGQALAPLPEWLQKVDEVLADAPAPEEPVQPARRFTGQSVQVPIWVDGRIRTAVYVRNSGESDEDFAARVMADVERRQS